MTTYSLNELNQIAYINHIRKSGEHNSFIYDYNANKKIVLHNESYRIADISQDGKLAITISQGYERKNRKLRVVEIETKEVVFETNKIFAYEACFTPVSNLLACRADVKKGAADWTFVFNMDTEEVIYKFPSAHCLEYGTVNFECNTFVFLGNRKGEVILFDFAKLDATIFKIPAKKMIHRVMQLDSKYLFLIDGDMNAIKVSIEYNAGGILENIIWKTRLDYYSFAYAPRFFINGNKLIFDVIAYNEETDYERQKNTLNPLGVNIEATGYICSLELASGNIKLSKIPKGSMTNTISKHFGDCVIDVSGNVVNMKTNEVVEFEVSNHYKRHTKIFK